MPGACPRHPHVRQPLHFLCSPSASRPSACTIMNASHPSPAAVTAAIAPAIAGDLGQRPGLAPETTTPGQERAAIRVAWARHLDEVRQAQRLRFRVFATEMGARLSTTLAGHDV